MILVRNVAPHGSIRHVCRHPEQQSTENPASPTMGRLVHVFRKRFPLTERATAFKERELMYARMSALLVALALAATTLASAQERFGNITGKVVDQTGAVLPGVTVTVTNNETQRSTVVVSDGNGVFYAAALDPGRYTVKFELSGFVTQEAPNVILLLGATASVDSSLRVGGLTETVQVLAGTPLIDVGSTTHQKNIPAEEFEVIPKGRRFQEMATALPSVNAGELE